ncbi:hypothetical protein O181_016699 [Austropuccinia psidii MF-1]|uniref:Uncharacterized protein n=1 Tax=Austropuccinia psidii MF-1 TaxID=1389203 RepID=A0A9Q3C277_9BASI|nr:hypothetical protein [Austropuccinia psidii MF-1]
MSPVHHRDQPKDIQGQFRTRTPGSGHHSGLQDNEGNNPMLPFTIKFNRDLKPEDWKDMNQVIQLHELLKALFQWSMDNKRFKMRRTWSKIPEGMLKRDTIQGTYGNYEKLESQQEV